MNKQKILLVLTLLFWLTWINVSHASTSNLIDYTTWTSQIEVKQEEAVKTKRKSSKEEKVVENFSELNNILNNQIQANVLWYLNKNISLTTLKKVFKKNLQSRKKIHKTLVEAYNKDFSDNLLTLISTNSNQIEQVKSIKELFFKGEVA